MNKIDRWFNRNNIQSTHRKMKEWGLPIYDYKRFFEEKIFETKLTDDEVLSLETRLHLENVKEDMIQHF